MKGTYIRGMKLYPAHYALLYYTRGKPKTFNRIRTPIPTCRHCGRELKDYGGHRNKLNPLGLNLTDFWDDTSPNRHQKFKIRPGVNELKLMIPERAILISTQEGDIVFDPFGGGGSTFQAAELNNRYWVGTELYDSEHIKNRMMESFPLYMRQEPEFDYKGLFKADENHES
jgi:site-specific DNA-methyltransferase (adenine-specific)